MKQSSPKHHNIIDRLDFDSILEPIEVDFDEDLFVEEMCTMGKYEVCPCDNPICLDSNYTDRKSSKG